jgi:hypothetical protein
VLFDRGLEELQQSTAALAVSLRTSRRNTDNPVFRLSAEQQFADGLRWLCQLLALPAVPYDAEGGRRLSDALAPFLQLVPQIHWSAADAQVTALFQEQADVLFALEKVAVVGRPSSTFETLLATRATIPAAAPGSGTVAPAASPAPEEPVLLHETLFSHGAGQGSQLAHVGSMYLAVLVHVRGLTQEQASKSISPAALMGFAQSLDAALAHHVGPAAFRIVRTSDKLEMQLRRMSSRPA